MLRTVDMVEAGWVVYSRTLTDADGYPIGGRVFATEGFADPETGETGRRLRVVSQNNRKLQLRSLLDSDVDQTTMDVPNPVFVRDLWRLLSREVGKQKGVALGLEGEYLDAANRLYRSVAVR